MTNKQKEEYISVKIVSGPDALSSERMKISFVLDNTPKKLYKFRRFDEYAFRMIDDNYVYLTKAEKLDDPFDCFTTVDPINDFQSSPFELTSKNIDHISKIFAKYFSLNSKDSLSNLIPVFKQVLKSYIKYKEKKPNKNIDCKGLNDKDNHINVMIDHFINLLDDLGSNEKVSNNINMFINGKNQIGVCSLTTKRDNKVMWSQYANIYKGYCIEYDIPRIEAVMNNLFPVIYKRKYNNSIYYAFLEFAVANAVRVISKGQGKYDLSSIIQLVCMKDSDRAYQDEWRLIGPADNNFYELTISAIYLGFDVSEENEKEIIERARKMNFKVYKMNKPDETNKISYTLLETTK